MKSHMDKITIIIPVYRVEAFLRKCIESVIEQTYDHLEIILVDDGSPDNCPSICDEYARLDQRIKVIHQKNGGISAARNAGIELASGDYIAFVDSDDWVERDMYEVLYEKARALDADITICGYYIVKENKISLSCVIEEDIVYSMEEALGELLQDTKVRNYLWNKLYKRDLFTRIRFPVAAAYEDMAAMYQLFVLANRIALIDEYKYYYSYRKEGLSKQSAFRYGYDLFKAARDRYDDLRTVLPKYENEMLQYAVAFALSAYNKSLKEKLSNQEKGKRDEILNFIQEYNKELTNHHHLSKVNKVSVRLIGKYGRIYRVMYFVYSCFRETIEKHIFLKSFIFTLSNYITNDEEYHGSEVQQATMFLMGTPEHDNLGDHAVAYATREYLATNFPDYKIEEIPENNVFVQLSDIRRRIQENDYIVYNGGGNIGNQYPHIEAIRRAVIKAFPHNKMIIFPQTVFFTNDRQGERQLNISRKTYNAHQDLTIVARERYSYDLCKRYFNDSKILLAPDIVMNVELLSVPCRRQGAVVCLRNDAERKLTVEDQVMIKEQLAGYYNDVAEIDTCSDHSIREAERMQALEAKWRQFRQAELVVTDRLYGMIFSAITETPCIALSGSTHKIPRSYEWLKHLKYIQYVDDVKDLNEKIQVLRSLKGEMKYNNDFAKVYLAKIVENM
jgi:exopolysaccharide biosynthesis predicted pyruvyltransferase EpsI/glycosyltransferase involved in cell wall biosynthesis